MDNGWAVRPVHDDQLEQIRRPVWPQDRGIGRDPLRPGRRQGHGRWRAGCLRDRRRGAAPNRLPPPAESYYETKASGQRPLHRGDAIVRLVREHLAATHPDQVPEPILSRRDRGNKTAT